MNYKIDFNVSNFGINTMNSIGLKMLIDNCGGEAEIINQINDAYHSGIIGRRISDSCKNRIRELLNPRIESKYKNIKVRGVGLVPKDLCLKYDSVPYSYRCWSHVLERCINPKGRWIDFYDGCKISDEWLEYSKFEEWYNKQVGHNLKYDLDKDLLGNGKLYSPETCCLLPHSLNIIIESRKNTGGLPTGVYKSRNKFICRVSTGNNRTTDRKVYYLGTFDNPEEAHQKYCEFKERRIKEVSKSYYDKGELDERAYKALINFKVK